MWFKYCKISYSCGLCLSTIFVCTISPRCIVDTSSSLRKISRERLDASFLEHKARSKANGRKKERHWRCTAGTVPRRIGWCPSAAILAPRAGRERGVEFCRVVTRGVAAPRYKTPILQPSDKSAINNNHNIQWFLTLLVFIIDFPRGQLMIMFFLCTGEASCTDKTEKLSFHQNNCLQPGSSTLSLQSRFFV